ncbi:hypothetical protein GGI12_001708 [Dipsacomyces acuminosporus]|nr:hypothetical protein GGI12_001708 [Dipsacomyces acuminosporus]
MTANGTIRPAPEACSAGSQALEAAQDMRIHRRQVRRSTLTLTADGYHIRSLDSATDTLLLKFDGSTETPDESAGRLDGQAADKADGSSSHEAGSGRGDGKLTLDVHVIAGIFELELFRYVLVVTDSRRRGALGGCDIFEAANVAALPLDYDSGAKVLEHLIANIKSKSRAADPATSASASPHDRDDTNTLVSTASHLPDPNNSNDSGNGSIPKEKSPGNGVTLPPTDISLSWLSPQIAKLIGRDDKGQQQQQQQQQQQDESASTSPANAGSDSSTTSLDSVLNNTTTDSAHDDAKPAPADAAQENISKARESKAKSSVHRMEQRIIDEICRVFASSGMFYSYRYDLTRSLQEKDGQTVVPDETMLSDIASADYWFNHHIQQPLLSSNASQWAVPLIQGYVQIAICNVQDGDSFQICILSRRNCRRIGMRYERRGANAQGFVANFVETEQVLSLALGNGLVHYMSFLQTRGSIPFYWKQPSSGLHPVPVVLKSDEDNAAVCARHLQHEIDRTGRQVLVNLVEQKGREAIAGSKYASLVGYCVSEELVDARYIRYVPWDFHHETRGMRFETLNELLGQLQREISDMDYFWGADTHQFTKQQGVFRVNCMDCLDRTNVVQSTIARYVLNEQLVRLGVHIAPEDGLGAYPGLDVTLNHLWANNGDYISRQYAGTSAMKGDFTRTGKRNFGGVMSDASYSLARLWINTFRDYFSQSVLDYIMGSHKAVDVYRTLVDLKSQDPDRAAEVSRMRESAIESSIAIVVHDGECVQIALIVHSPMAHSTRKIRKAKDAVMVLTDAAIYICLYDYPTEKVSEYMRIELSRLARVQHGAYITDTAVPQSLDSTYNYGLLLHYTSSTGAENGGSSRSVEKPGSDEHAEGEDNSIPDGSSLASPSGADAGASSASISVQKLAAESDTHASAAAASIPTPAPASYIACKLVGEAQVVMQLMPGQGPAAVSPASNNGAAALSLARLKSLESQPPCLLAECLCSVIQSAKSSSVAGDSSHFIVEDPIISASEAKRGVNIIDQVSMKLHKAMWI